MVDRGIEVKGLIETQNKFNQVVTDLRGATFLQGMRNAVLMVTRDARLNVPVDTGQLKNSIIGEVKQSLGSNLTQGIVGSNKSYAPFVELGTKPHFPPLAALETWARRHGTSAFVVAKGIAAKGTKANRYLQRAFDSNKDNIESMLGKVIAGIVGK